MVLCSVPGCKNRSDLRNWKTIAKSDKENPKITFHRFPKDATTRSLWLDILGLQSICSSARICSIHFDEKFIDRSSPSLVRLKSNALPHKVCLTETIPDLDLSNKRRENSCDSDETTLTQTSQELLQLNTLVTRSTSPIPDFGLQRSTSKVDKATNVTLQDFSKVPNNFQISRECSTSKKHASTMVSPTKIYNSPEKSRLRQRIQFLQEESRKKIRSLQQGLRRQTDQIATLKSVLKTLKDKQLLNEEQADMIDQLGGTNGEIFQR